MLATGIFFNVIYMVLIVGYPFSCLIFFVCFVFGFFFDLFCFFQKEKTNKKNNLILLA